MQDADRQRGAVGLDEIDIEAMRLARRGAAARARDEGGPVLRHDLGKLERPCGDIAKIEAEPLGERRVQIVDGAIAVGGEEAGRSVVEIGDGRLQLLEACLLPLPVGRDLLDLPDDEAASLRPDFGSAGMGCTEMRNQRAATFSVA